MDNTGLSQNVAQDQNTQSQAVSTPTVVQQPTGQPIDKTTPIPPVSQAVPVSPVGQMHKEQELVQTPVPEALVEPSETEPALHPEVEGAGVEKVSHVPDLTLEDKKAGLQLAKESTQVSTQPSGVVQLPMTEEETLKQLRFHRKVADSVSWWLISILRQFKMMHRKLINA